MIKRSFIIGIAFLSFISAQPLMAENSVKDNPWEKFSFNMGGFFSSSSTDLRFGTGVGLSVNVEDVFGLDTETSVFRLDSYWRFSDNRRHRVEL